MERAQILEEIGKMSVLELSQLIKDMEEKFGVSAAAAVAVAGPAAAAAAAPKEEQTEFTVMLNAACKPSFFRDSGATCAWRNAV